MLPSDAQKDKNALDAIKNAYNDLLQKATDQNKPKGSSTFTIKSVDNDSGKLAVTIKYEYGGYTVNEHCKWCKGEGK